MESSSRAKANLSVWGCQAKARTTQSDLVKQDGQKGRKKVTKIQVSKKTRVVLVTSVSRNTAYVNKDHTPYRKKKKNNVADHFSTDEHQINQLIVQQSLSSYTKLLSHQQHIGLPPGYHNN